MAGGQVAQGYIHDADTGERRDLVAEVLAHAPYLPVEALGKHDTEAAIAFLPHKALLGHLSQYGYAT